MNTIQSSSSCVQNQDYTSQESELIIVTVLSQGHGLEFFLSLSSFSTFLIENEKLSFCSRMVRAWRS